MRASVESAAPPTFLPSVLHAPAQERRNERWIQEIFPVVAFSSSVSVATFDFVERHWTTTGWLFLLFHARFIAKAAGRCQVDSLDLVTTETAFRAHPAEGNAEQL